MSNSNQPVAPSAKHDVALPMENVATPSANQPKTNEIYESAGAQEKEHMYSTLA